MDYEALLDELDGVSSQQDVDLKPLHEMYPSVKHAESVVIDEKVFKDRFLFGVVNRGGAILPFNNGKGLAFTKKGDWVTIQILDAGCGKSVRKQSPDFAKKPKQTKETLSVAGNSGTIDAFGGDE